MPQTIAATSDFVQSFRYKKLCSGGSVRSQADLEALRFCTVVSGPLSIEVGDAAADYSALFDIATVQGMIFLACEMLC